MVDLLKGWVILVLLFIYIGVDYFGLYVIKEGWKELKWYGCFFICLVSRVVYIEIVNFFEIDFFI